MSLNLCVYNHFHRNQLIRPETQDTSVPLSANLVSLQQMINSVLPQIFQKEDACDFKAPGIFRHHHLCGDYEKACIRLKEKLAGPTYSDLESTCKTYVLAQLEGFGQAFKAMGQRYHVHETALKNVITRIKIASSSINLPVRRGQVQSQVSKRIDEFRSYLVKIESLMETIAQDQKVIQRLIFDYAPIAKLVRESNLEKLPDTCCFPGLTISRMTPGWEKGIKWISKFYQGFGKDPDDPESLIYSGYIQALEGDREYLDHWMTNVIVLQNLFSFVISSLENEKTKQSLSLAHLTSIELPLALEDHLFSIMNTEASPDFEHFLNQEASYLCNRLSEGKKWMNEAKESMSQFNRTILQINQPDYPGRLSQKIQRILPQLRSIYTTFSTCKEQVSLLLDGMISASCHFVSQDVEENHEKIIEIKSLRGKSAFFLDPNSPTYAQNLKALMDFRKQQHSLCETIIPKLQAAHDSIDQMKGSTADVYRACRHYLDQSKQLHFDLDKLGRLQPRSV